ncbi:MAG: DUF975 family protein [Oscillospiraceae bacterium]|jgi:uncharacterized membrane protein|nr:DUF975 family protein [Oscillospiraceae bacterium]
MNRPALKRQAQETILQNLKTVLICTLLLVLLTLIFSAITGRLMKPTLDQLSLYYEQLLQGKEVSSYSIQAAVYSHPREMGVSYLLQWLLMIVEFGFMLFLFNVIRAKPASYGNLLDGFAIWWKILLLHLVMGLFVFLWSLLLIVPGFIAAYRYRMAPFLLLTHPEYGIMDCIRESKSRMAGYKMAFFLLDLSFLGWELLTLVPVLGWAVMVWVKPYRQSTELLYCMQISEPYDLSLWEREDPRFANR